MELLRLDIYVAREDIVEDYVLDERTLVVLLVVEILDVRQSHGENGGDLLGEFVLSLYENDIFPLGTGAYGTVGVTGGRDGLGGVRDLVADILPHLADLDELGAGDDRSVLVEDTDNAVHGIPHLVDDTLK